jgi:hypothetical protein
MNDGDALAIRQRPGPEVISRRVAMLVADGRPGSDLQGVLVAEGQLRRRQGRVAVAQQSPPGGSVWRDSLAACRQSALQTNELVRSVRTLTTSPAV